MKQLWSWGGKYIGLQQGEYLVDCDGKVLGKFYEHEIFNQEGYYIGELGRNERILVNSTKKNQRRPLFSYGVRGTISQRRRDFSPYPLLQGFEDFIVN